MSIENTCNPENCKLFELLGGEPSSCPNYQESWWTPENGGQPVLIKDCAPKRTMLMIQEIYGRLTGVQKASEQERNAMLEFAQAVNNAKDVVSIEINKPLLEVGK